MRIIIFIFVLFYSLSSQAEIIRLEVLQYGASCNGSSESPSKIQDAIDAAFDNSPAILDFQGRTCKINAKLTIPEGGNVHFENGVVIASASYPDSFLFETIGTNALAHHDIDISDMTLDGTQQADLIKLDNYLRVSLSNNHFIHYPGGGVELDKTSDSHEVIISHNFMSQYLYGESISSLTGTAVIDNVGDSIIEDNISGYGLDFVQMNGKYSILRNNHAYPSRYFYNASSSGSWGSLIGNYIDSSGVYMNDPWNTEIVGNKFLQNTGSNFNFITLNFDAAGSYIDGLKITNNSFQNNNAHVLTPVAVTLSGSGSVNNSGINNNYILNNSFINTTPMTTHPVASLHQTATANFVFNFSGNIPFGAIQSASESFMPDSTSVFPSHKIYSISGSTVTGAINYPVNGTMYMEGDVNVTRN